MAGARIRHSVSAHLPSSTLLVDRGVSELDVDYIQAENPGARLRSMQPTFPNMALYVLVAL